MKQNILAIVIPFYKIKYFDVLLNALTKQTNKAFHVYIGDDCSPTPPNDIIKKYKTKLNLTYQRYKENLGEKNLTSQWTRCIEMIQDEQWVWILPDDDLPSETCVEEFYKALPLANENKIKVFRLGFQLIDEKGAVTSSFNFKEPKIENNLNYYKRLIKGDTASSLGDNIFHYESLLKSGGFIEFPKAWGSDHATLLNVSSGGTLYFLSNTTLFFRMSGENISSDRSDGVEKMKARIMFAKWLKNNEKIFSEKPEKNFYRFFYWKGEYYVLYEWKFSIKLFYQLYKLREICLEEKKITSLITIFLKKAQHSIQGK